MITSMASLVNYTLPTLCTFTNKHSVSCNLYACVVLQSRTQNFHFSHSAINVFSPWDGLKHLCILPVYKSLQLEIKGKCKGRAVYASLFGVGAPEALVIGVVALLVFGPKGLAEVARNLGKTLRAFQPTIRELQDISRDFKSSLQREIGLDDIQNSIPKTYTSTDYTDSTPASPAISRSQKDSQTVVDPNGVASPNSSYSSEELFTEEHLKAVPVIQESSSPSEKQLKFQTQEDGASEMVQHQKPQNDVQSL